MDDDIKRIMASVFGVDAGTINEDTSPDSLENWDSIAQLNLVSALEEEFDLEFEDEEIADMISYKLVKHLIGEKLGSS